MMGRPDNAREGARQRSARLRQRARALRAQGLSFREIARELGCSIATAHDWATSVPGQAPPPPKNNSRARVHGVWSAPVIGELQEGYRQKARERWPFLSADDTETWSRLASRVEQAASYEASEGAVSGDRIRHVSTSLVAWESKLAKLTAEYDREAERRAEAGQRGGEHGRREWGHLARLAEGPAVRAVVRRCAAGRGVK
jgi:transcriptional regulator with XRE-family HTH domain